VNAVAAKSQKDRFILKSNLSGMMRLSLISEKPKDKIQAIKLTNCGEFKITHEEVSKEFPRKLSKRIRE